ncbi:LysR family transcriptional regulator [Fodinicola feengrottensis]|uniref:LysR family transcriptional regulator n=1 Tax=Fodinicola feengrottensis TaxID=435914 RepID=A0ABN2GJU3_9ACTN
MALELRSLRSFIVTATELHFSRTAKRLHVSQSALSQQIKALEDSLGVPLFVRTSRMVELTPAGEALLEAAPRILFEVDRAVDRVRKAADGTAGTLAIGSVGTALTSIAPRIMRALRQEAPDLRFEVTQLDTDAQLLALADRRLDVAIVREARPHPALCLEQLVSEPLVVVLPDDHRYANQAQIRPGDLAREHFILWPRQLGAEFYDIIIGYCREHGFSPDIVAEGADIETQLGLVASGLGISLQPAYYSNLRMVGIQFRPLTGSPPVVSLQLAWHRNNISPAVQHFVDTARAVAQTL